MDPVFVPPAPAAAGGAGVGGLTPPRRAAGALPAAPTATTSFAPAAAPAPGFESSAFRAGTGTGGLSKIKYVAED